MARLGAPLRHREDRSPRRAETSGEVQQVSTEDPKWLIEAAAKRKEEQPLRGEADSVQLLHRAVPRSATRAPLPTTGFNRAMQVAVLVVTLTLAALALTGAGAVAQPMASPPPPPPRHLVVVFDLLETAEPANSHRRLFDASALEAVLLDQLPAGVEPGDVRLLDTGSGFEVEIAPHATVTTDDVMQAVQSDGFANAVKEHQLRVSNLHTATASPPSPPLTPPPPPPRLPPAPSLRSFFSGQVSLPVGLAAGVAVVSLMLIATVVTRREREASLAPRALKASPRGVAVAWRGVVKGDEVDDEAGAAPAVPCSSPTQQKVWSPTTSIEQTTRRAEAGDTEAMMDLGLAYYIGLDGVSKDITQAYKWYQRAADGGYPTGMARRLGFLVQASGDAPALVPSLSGDEVEAVERGASKAGRAGGPQAGPTAQDCARERGGKERGGRGANARMFLL